MSAYNLGFGRKLAETAHLVAADGLDSFDAIQTVIYLSLLSCEITLKVLLERSGLPVKQIKAHWHDLDELLREVSRCEVEVEIVIGNKKWVPAARIRRIPINSEGAESTVGKILTGEFLGVSKYPNQIRYGSGFLSYPPDALIKTACAVVDFAETHWDKIRQPASQP